MPLRAKNEQSNKVVYTDRIILLINMVEESKQPQKFEAQKLSDKIKTAQTPWFSFEYFPPKTEAGVENLVDRMERMAHTKPLWMDVTWGAGGSTSDKTIELCNILQQLCHVEALMHLTCTNMTMDMVVNALKEAKECGIRNILALRGDPPRGQAEFKALDNGFAHATDLIKYIKDNYGDYFCIVVAGYPETHVEATSTEDDLKYLKEKCDMGADIVITQMFYDVDVYNKWVADCRACGITAEIIPGLMPVLGYDRFHR